MIGTYVFPQGIRQPGYGQQMSRLPEHRAFRRCNIHLMGVALDWYFAERARLEWHRFLQRSAV